MSDLAEEILFLLTKKGKVEVREIQDRYNLSRETGTTIMDFLVEFGFAEFDESRRYIRLSEPCKQFFETIDQDEENSDRQMLAVAYL